MRTEGKVSKVAICEKCNNFVMASHVDHIGKHNEELFTQLSNEGFTIKLETIEETRTRQLAHYKDCISDNCLNQTKNNNK